MAVFKHLTAPDIEEILSFFNIGSLSEYLPITKGIDNSNFKIITEQGKYILTLFNPRQRTEDLPYYMNFMEHLHNKGIPCPHIIKNHLGENISTFADVNYSIVSFMQGREDKNITLNHIKEAAQTLAKMHIASLDFNMQKPNAMNLEKCEELIKTATPAMNSLETGLSNFLQNELSFLQQNITQYKNLPRANIHADFFPDNVFFNEAGKISAVIDFYFSCYDFLIYDLMIAVNAWCFEQKSFPNKQKIKLFIEEYQKIRPISRDELSALTFFGRVAALRITSSRTYDWFFTPKDALINPHNPLEYVNILKAYINKEINL